MCHLSSEQLQTMGRFRIVRMLRRLGIFQAEVLRFQSLFKAILRVDDREIQGLDIFGFCLQGCLDFQGFLKGFLLRGCHPFV